MRMLDTMNEVLSLTKAGRLSEATRLIQQALRGEASQDDEASETTRTPAEADIVDAEFTEVALLPRVADPAQAEQDAAPYESTTGSDDVDTPDLTETAPAAEPASPPEAPATLEPDAHPAPPPQARKPEPSSAPKRRSTEGFSRQSFSTGKRAIDYRLYVPPGLVGTAPLVVMLHGCTQDPEDFARGTQMNALAQERGFIVAWPEQPATRNPQKCWNWFRPNDQRRGRGEPSLIAGLTRAIIAENDIDPARVYIAGLSAGGAAAAILAEAYPDIYAAVGIHSGLACGSAKDVPTAFAAMKRANRAAATRKKANFVPTITVHGDRDQTVHPSNSDAIIEAAASNPRLLAPSRKVTQGEAPGGRSFTRTQLADSEGRTWIEHWEISGGGHAWSGGNEAGSYADPAGPDASRAMVDFFWQHRLAPDPATI